VSLQKNRTYTYNFARVIPNPAVTLLDLGAFHGAELPYVFGSVPAPTDVDDLLGDRMRAYWTSFATKGKPKAKKAEGWGKYVAKSSKRKTLRFNTQLAKLDNFRRAQCDFWSTVYDQL
jgi:carboxylesterase type B